MADTRFKDVAERWLKVATIDLEPRTKTSYRRIVDSVLNPVFGDQMVAAVDQEDVQAVVTAWNDDYAGQTVRNRFNVLRSILRYGGNDVSVGKSNGGIVLPRQAKADDAGVVTGRLFLQDSDELRQLTDALPEAYRLMVTFAAMVGTRSPGETLELRAGDIINGQRVQVSRAVKRAEGKNVVGRTKTHRHRVVWVPPLLVETIRTTLDSRWPDKVPPNALLFPEPSTRNRHMDYWRLMRA